MIDFRDEYKKANEQITPDPAYLAALYGKLSAEMEKEEKRRSVFISFIRPMRIITVAACAVLVVGAAVALPNIIGMKSASDNAGEALADRSTITYMETNPPDYSAESILGTASGDNKLSADEAAGGAAGDMIVDNDYSFDGAENAISEGEVLSSSTFPSVSGGSTADTADNYYYLENAIWIYQYIFLPDDYGMISLVEAALPDETAAQYPDCTFYRVVDDSLTSTETVRKLLLTVFSESALDQLAAFSDANYFDYNGLLYVAVNNNRSSGTGEIVITGYYTGDSTVTYLFSGKSGDGSITFTANDSGDILVTDFTLPEILFNANTLAIN